MIRRASPFVVLVLAGLVIVAAGAGASSHRHSSPTPARGAAASHRRSSPPVARALIRSYAVFRRNMSVRSAVGGSAVLSDALIHFESAGPAERYALSFSQIQPTAVASTSVLPIPGSSGACLMAVEDQHGVVATCAPLSSVAGLGITDLLQSSAGTQTLVGLVPDGNATVVVTTDDGVGHKVSVADNVYGITSPEGFRTVSLRDSSGNLKEEPTPPRS